MAGRAWAQGTTQIPGWGYNDYGQLNTPSNLSGVTGVTQVACGYSHTYALKNDGTLVGWGWNGYGQTNTPGDLSGVTQVACGNDHTYALRPWSDCNTNGIFDGDDCVYGYDFDLNYDLTPDSCSQGVVPVRQDSGNLGVPIANVARSFTFPLSYRADAPVAIRIRAAGDLDANTEFLTVRFNGVTVRRCFETNGVNCTSGASNDTIVVSAVDFNKFVDVGNLTVTLLPSPAVNASECPGGGIWVAFDYPGIGPYGDCDADGVLDTREVGLSPMLDRNRNARLDDCEIRDDPSVDCNLNGVIDSYDIATGTTDDNRNGRIDLCEYAKGDLDLTGEVDTGDLGILLLYIGDFDSPIGDLDGDGWVTTADISMLLLNFGPVTWP